LNDLSALQINSRPLLKVFGWEISGIEKQLRIELRASDIFPSNSSSLEIMFRHRKHKFSSESEYCDVEGGKRPNTVFVYKKCMKVY